MKIRTAFSLVLGVGCSAIVLILLAIFISTLPKSHFRASEETLVDLSRILAVQARDELVGGSFSPNTWSRRFAEIESSYVSANIAGALKEKTLLHLYITDAVGTVLFDSRGKDKFKSYASWNDVHQTLKGEYGARTTFEKGRGYVLYIAAPLKSENKILGVISVGKPVADLWPMLRSSIYDIVLLVLIAGLTAFLLAMRMASIIVSPIEALTSYVTDLTRGVRGSVPKLRGHEANQLAESFHQLVETLEGKKYIERYVQTLTHEIKSPLAGIRAAAELIDDSDLSEASRKFVGNIMHDASRIQLLSDEMLLLSKLRSSPAALQCQECSLQEICQTAIDEVIDLATIRQVAVIMSESNPLLVKGDRNLLVKAISNLILNAVEFSPQKSEVTIALHREGQLAIITIEDSGSGIPEWASEKIFEHFFSLPRPDSKKKSSGMGIPLTKEIIEMHLGRVEILNRTNGGTRAQISLNCS